MKFVRWLVHTGGAQGRELLHHACVFPHVCFPAAALISYHGVFLRDEKLGQEGDSHRTSYQRPPPPQSVYVHVCVCSTFGSTGPHVSTVHGQVPAPFTQIQSPSFINQPVERSARQLSGLLLQNYLR